MLNEFGLYSPFRFCGALAPLLPNPRFKSECGGHSWFRANTMPPDRYSPQGAFDINMLDPQALDAAGGLAAAVRAIETVCHQGHSEIAEIVAALNSRPYILEYIISGMLRVPTRLYALPMLIISLCSAGGGGIRQALEVDSYRVPHIQNAKHDGCDERAAPPEILIFAVVRGISIRCRCVSEPPRVLQKGGTLVQCSEGTRGERRQCSDWREHIRREPQKKQSGHRRPSY